MEVHDETAEALSGLSCHQAKFLVKR